MDLTDVCLKVTYIFPSSAAFKIFLFVFVSGHFTPRSLDIWVFFVFILLEVRGASWAHSLMSFITFIKFLVIISLDIVSAPLSLSSLSGIPNAYMLNLFTIFFLLYSFLNFTLFSFLWIFSSTSRPLFSSGVPNLLLNPSYGAFFSSRIFLFSVHRFQFSLEVLHLLM